MDWLTRKRLEALTVHCSSCGSTGARIGSSGGNLEGAAEPEPAQGGRGVGSHFYRTLLGHEIVKHVRRLSFSIKYQKGTNDQGIKA